MDQMALKTVDGVVGHYIHLATHGVLSMSFDTYAERFRDVYYKTVPSQRVFISDEKNKAGKKLAKYFRQYGKVKLPAQLVPALIDALPEPHQSHCRMAVVNLINPRDVSGVMSEADALDLAARASKEDGDAQSAFITVAKGGIDVDDDAAELDRAEVELLESIEEKNKQLKVIREVKRRRDDVSLKAVPHAS